MPGTAVDETVRFRLEEPEPGAAMEAGLNAAVTPTGNPLADKVTAASKPSTVALAIVDEPMLPCLTETETGEADKEKDGVCDVDPVKAAMRPAFGDPHPVTRS